MKGIRTTTFALRMMLAVLLVATFLPSTPLSAASNAWSKLDLDGIRINAVLADPTNANIIFAGTQGGGIFRSTNGGQSWTAVNNGLGNLFVNDLMFDPRDRTVVLAATGRGPAVGEMSAGVYRSTNRGDSWTQQVSAFADALAVDPTNPTTMYAAGAPNVLKSTNGGIAWAPSGSGIVNTDGTGIAVDTANPSIVLFVGNTEGGTGRIFRSTDAGASWNLVFDNLPSLFDVTFGPPSAGAFAFVASDMGVLRSTDSGQTFTTVTGGLGNIAVFRVLVNPASGGTVFGATIGQGVIRSTDAGASWSVLDGTLGNKNVRGLGINLATPQTLFGGTEDGVWAFTFAPVPPPPSIAVSWFFSEGSTQPPFDTWFLLQNPTGKTATATLNFLLQGGGTVTQVVAVPPTSRVSVFANQVLPNQAFSTRIDADQPIFTERAMYVSFDGHAVTGIPAPSKTWLFAEGSTQPPFHTWILLANQNATPASATITYFLENGQTMVQQLGSLAPLSRTSVFVNEVLPNVAFSFRVDSSLPIVAERAMYRFPGNAATGVVGVPAPARTWFFSEGRTTLSGMRADTFLLLQNPNTTGVTATIRLFRTDGTMNTFTVALGSTSRTTIFLNSIFSGEFGISVEATGNIIAERSVFFGAQEPLGAYATQGATQLGTVWLLPEGSTAPPFNEIISLLNPSSSNMSVRAEFELQTGQVIVRDFTVGPNRKFDISVDSIIPNAAVSTRITTSSPTVVERTMLINKSSLGATNTIGIRQQ